MPIHRFFCEDLSLSAKEAVLTGGEAAHAGRVLRLAVGDSCVLLNGAGLVADGEIVALDRHSVSCRVIQCRDLPRPMPELRLYVAPPKGKNLDLLLKMATELGVSRVTPIICRYGVSRPDEAKESWHEVFMAACKQSGNPWIPQADAPMKFADAVAASDEFGFVGAVPRREKQMRADDAAFAKGRLALWIGPEGGFTQEEEGLLLDKGVVAMTVGNWILRVETAVPALCGAILDRWKQSVL